MARDASGTYTRVSNSFSSPQSQTVISPTDAESFFDELETEMTDSLSRSGKGGMSATAVLKIADGTSAAPALTFNNDTDTGIARTTANTMIAVASGVAVITVTPSGVALGTDLAVTEGGTGASNAAGARTNLGAAASATLVTAGAGLTGGGDLSTDRTLTVGAGTGIAVNADDVALAAVSAYAVMVNNTGSSAAPTGVKISALTDRTGFGSGDKFMIEESTGELRKVDYDDLPGAGSLGGSTGATDNAALRANGTGGATVQSSALVIADTTGALSRSGGGGIQVQGTNTNDSAAAGEKGEVVTSAVASGSAVSMSSGTATDITSISLTAGDWDVSGTLWITTVGTVTSFNAWINTTATTEPTRGGTGHSFVQGISIAGGSDLSISLSPKRLSLSATTTVYLGGRTTAGSNGFGTIFARRVR